MNEQLTIQEQFDALEMKVELHTRLFFALDDMLGQLQEVLKKGREAK